MKVKYLTRNKRITFECDVSTAKEAFERVAEFQEVFEETQCGACGSFDVRYVCREVDGNKYYEMRCQERDCRARLEFGQLREGGGLFVKRKDKDGNWRDNYGWYIYRINGVAQEEGELAPSDRAG